VVFQASMSRQFTFVVADPSLAAAVASLDDSERERVLTLGLPLLKAADAVLERSAGTEWAGKLKEERERADAAELQADARVKAALEMQAAVVRDTRAAAATERAQALAEMGARVEEYQRQLEEARATAYTKLEHATQRVRAEYEARIAAVEERERVLLGSLQAVSIRDVKSTSRGADGEALACDLLHQLFPAAEIEDCRNVTAAGDFVVLEDDLNMMVEVKNYTRNVARSEIDKFKRDMLANPTYTCGVLASIKSGICGKTDFQVEVIGDRPVVYIHNLEQDGSRIRQAANVFRMLHSIENADLRRQGALDAIAVEIQEKRQRTQQLRVLADRHAAALASWAEQDEARSSAVLRRALGEGS
jgi:hypothetical protein